MKYPLEQIHDVRILREKNAMARLQEAELIAQKCEQVVAACEQAIEAYKIYMREKEEALYNELIGKNVALVDVDTLALQIESLQAHLLVLRQELQDAVEKRDAALKVVEQAKAEYQKMVKNRSKIDEHRTIWEKAAVEEIIRREEEEIDELGQSHTVSI